MHHEPCLTCAGSTTYHTGWNSPWCRGCLAHVEPITRQQCHWDSNRGNDEFIDRISKLIKSKTITPDRGRAPRGFKTGAGAIRIQYRKTTDNNSQETT